MRYTVALKSKQIGWYTRSDKMDNGVPLVILDTTTSEDHSPLLLQTATMASTIAIDINHNEEEQTSLTPTTSSIPLDERILSVVRNAASSSNDNGGNGDGGKSQTITIRPALLASELGLSVEEATRELCGLLSAVGGGEDGATFRFERVELPSAGNGTLGDASADANANATSTTTATITTMVFTFPPDFETRAKSYQRQSDYKQRLQTLSIGFIKAIKIVTAFGLIISLAVVIVAAICLLVAAVIALARGGHGGGGGHHRNQLTHRLRYLFFQLRQLLWLYAICGSAIDNNQDPFMREVAGDVAMCMSLFCGNPMHPFFWFRVGGMRRRWARVRQTRGWGGSGSGGGNNGGSTTWDSWNNNDGIAMMRRGSWGNNNSDHHNYSTTSNSGSSSSDQSHQRGLLSIAVEFLFGPESTSSSINSNNNNNNSNLPPPKELEKWKFRAYIIMTLSSTTPESGIALRDLLPYVDNPPKSAEDPSAIRETLRIVTYFNGKPVVVAAAANGNNDSSSGGSSISGMDARFCFPEIISEMNCQKLLVNLGNTEFAPPPISSSIDDNNSSGISSILYKEEVYDFGSSSNAASDDVIPDYLYEKPHYLTELSRQQFGQCALLGILNFVGLIMVQTAMMPGGLLELPVAGAVSNDSSKSSSSRRRSGGSSSGSLIAFASVLILKLLSILRFYAGLFFAIPLLRLIIVLIRNYGVEKRNLRRKSFVRAEL